MKEMICEKGKTCIYFTKRIVNYRHIVKYGKREFTKKGEILYVACKRSGLEKPMRKYLIECPFKQTDTLELWTGAEHEQVKH